MRNENILLPKLLPDEKSHLRETSLAKESGRRMRDRYMSQVALNGKTSESVSKVAIEYLKIPSVGPKILQ